ncbi:hypothetical protein, partial [Mycobacterium sp. URHD0025]|uniref:hypothetical protein n=1 Tax=Mycobacterium sp. URHD0025 TaxID=1298864 RepID=UPI00336ABE46
MLISAPRHTRDPAAVPTTSGLCESIRVWASWVETSATRASVEARLGASGKPAVTQAPVAAPAVAAPR